MKLRNLIPNFGVIEVSKLSDLEVEVDVEKIEKLLINKYHLIIEDKRNNWYSPNYKELAQAIADNIKNILRIV